MANPVPMPILPEFFYEEEWVDLCEKIIATNAIYIMVPITIKNSSASTKPYLEILLEKKPIYLKLKQRSNYIHGSHC